MKKIGALLVIIGILCFCVVCVIINGNLDKNYFVDTTKVEGQKIENSQYKTFEYDNNFNYDYVKSHSLENKMKIIFPLFDNMDKDDISGTEFYKSFIKNDINVTAMVIQNSDFSLNQYIDDVIKSYDDDAYEKYNYSASKNSILISGIKSSYLKINYVIKENAVEDEASLYNEEFYIFIQTDYKEFVEIKYSITGKKLTDELLTKIINNITVERNAANFLVSEVVNNQLVGTLYNIKTENTNENYSLTFKVSNSKYEEIENENNTTNYTTFKSKSDNFIVAVELTNYFNQDIKEFIEDEKIYSYLNTESYDVQDYLNSIIFINNKEFQNFSFNYKENNQIKYFNMYVNLIDNNVIYIITIKSSDIIEANEIEDFFEYTYS